MSAGLYEIQPQLPWDVSADEKRRLVILYSTALVFVALFATMIWLTPVRELDRSVTEAVPPRVAKMLMQQEVKPLPPPPKPEVKPEPEAPKEEPKPEPNPEPEPPKQEVKKEPPKKVEPKKEAPKPVDAATSAAQKQQAAKQKAAAAAAVFDDSLADVRDTSDLSALKTAPQSNLAAGPGTAADGVGVKTDRAMLSRAAVGGSGGVAIAKASSGGGGTGKLGGGGAGGAGGGYSTTQVKSAIAD
ncbi:MAG TPA: hypothetical protein VM553_16865, partial [Dongiaceae bacterium]|nr:hypothetical protein [Dongiaceae bacterium]